MAASADTSVRHRIKRVWRLLPEAVMAALVAALCRKDGPALPVAWKVTWNSHLESSQKAMDDEYLSRLAGYFTDQARVVIVLQWIGNGAGIFGD